VRGRTLGIDLLMTIAVVGAALIGEWAEAAAVVVLFALGALLEGLTMDKARNAIRSLMDLSPRTAYVRTEEGEQEVPVEKLVPGDIVMVRPGDLVAADGQVVAGRTTIDQASITGESVPVEKQVDDEVFAGTANQRGYIEVVVTRRAEDTTLARIISLVEEAQARRAPAQRFVDRFASRYTPAVLLLAILIAAVPPLLGAAFLPWVYKALVLLVIACPCALVISTPVSIVAGIARASRSGVLIKGGAFLEAMASTRVIAFDKTGTLTQGKPVVTDILPCAGQDEATVLAIAAAVESRSEHPLAGAILCAARERDLSWPEVEHFEALPGCGAHAMLGDEPVQIGNERLFPNATPDVRGRIAAWQDVGKTVLLVGRSGHLIGLIAVTDTLRPRAEEAIHELRAAGVHTIVMLTGDGERTADVVARRLGLDDRRAGLLPEQKTLVIQELLRKHGQVAMVGDGVNDAPALATASVGIAMGAAGSDTALETADVALMGDDLRHLPYLINLSRATLRTIRANIAFSIVVKIIFLALTLLGFASLWLAILADTGAALLVIANGMRLLRFQAGRQ
jgi:Cd2+/Zn2+-exporting ATPase